MSAESFPRVSGDAVDISGRDTIVAISTPPGRGGIGVVRISGPLATRIIPEFVKLSRPLEHGRARLSEIFDVVRDAKTNGLQAGVPSGTFRLDEAVVTFFAAPNSYTTDDVVEIAAHGSPVLLDFLLRAAIRGGARLAEPGEFTQRAFLSGRIDLTQAEAVRDLIEAQTLEQARVAARQMSGGLSQRVKPIKRLLVELMAALEAGIDFAEDDIDVMAAAEILTRLDEAERPLEEVAQSFAYGRVLRDGLMLAVIGRPNVGKSSLFNRLVERERAIVTAQPGTTRDLISERTVMDGIPVELVDTAGLREATEEVEVLGIARSRQAFADADLVLLVLDASEKRNAEEDALLEAAETDKRILVVRNKIDLVEAGNAANFGELRPGIKSEGGDERLRSAVATSASTGAGVAELRGAILKKVRGETAQMEGAPVTNLRQHQEVLAALEGLARARAAIEASIPHEMLMMDLHSALEPLDRLTGQTTPDDILNLIFSSFCIGK